MVTITPLPTRTARWGEGPVWWRDHLWLVDIEGHALHRFNPVTGDTTVWPRGERIGFALPCADDRWICGGDSGIYLFNPASGESRSVAHPEADRPANRFNDAAVAPDGRLFAGTIATDKCEGAANLYRIDPDLSCHRVLSGLTNSNGMDWSPDGKILYHIDTPTRLVNAYTYGPGGSISDPKAFIDTDTLLDASPDGLTVDADGNLWIAFCHGGCVMQFDAKTGDCLRKIDLPCIETTSCCFGGPDLNTLYITTGIAPKKEEEHAGKVFAITGLSVSGRPQTQFRNTP